MTKRELRRYYLEKRSSLSNEELIDASNKINRHLINLLDNEIQYIHCYLPLKNSSEINVWGFIAECWDRNIKTATSITHFNPKRLEHSWFNRGTVFSSGAFNTQIPNPICQVNIELLDWVIVPLLCIDTLGNRIGYGQGFYDGFLSKLSPETRKIGVSLFEPLTSSFETDEWDVKLDGVVTQEGYNSF